MSSTRPYLIRAFYEWIIDNNCTPHVVVNADVLGTDVPREYIDGGQIVLNIAMSAVQSLSLGNDLIYFQARFNGIAREVSIPIKAVMAIYARENGRGMVFTEDDGEEDPPPGEEKTTTKGTTGSKEKNSKRPGGKPSHLTVVK
jgi:stringent starvation protein B